MINFQAVSPTNENYFLKLLEENAMQGWLNMLMTRQPSYLAHQHYFGQEYPILAEEAGNYLGCYQLTKHQGFINGELNTLGYLNSLRITPAYRHKIRVIKAGFDHLRQSMHIPDYCYTSIASDNKVAKRLLEKGLASLPSYRPLGELCTLVIAQQQSKSYNLWQPTQNYQAVVNFYNHQARQYQLAPYLDPAWLKAAKLPVLVHYQNKKITACAVLWNQQAFKQIMVNQYHPLVKLARPFYNGYAQLTGRPLLPNIKQTLDQTFLAFFQIADEQLLLPLLTDALNYCRTRLLTLSLAKDQPLLKNIIKKLKAITYQTTIYGVDLMSHPNWLPLRLKPEAAIL